MLVIFRIVLVAVIYIASCIGADSSLAQGKPRLPWTDGRTLEYNAVNQDLKLLLRSIVRADGGFNIIIKNDVKGEVTVQFSKVPVAAAFNQIIEENNQIGMFYCSKNGEIDEKFNPNGSSKNIAGIFNKEKNILGMMPHPERMIDKYLSGDDGATFFETLLNNLK